MRMLRATLCVLAIPFTVATGDGVFEDDSAALMLLQSRAVETPHSSRAVESPHSSRLAAGNKPSGANSSQLQQSPSLWSGMDLAESPRQTFLKDSFNHEEAWPTQIMGHYNSGTNLLEALLQANFPDQFTILDNNMVVGSCLFWKHSSLSVLRDSDASVFTTCKDRVIGIAIVRNPLPWLVSFREAAYDLYSCNKGDDWLTRPCVYPSFAPSYLGGKSYDSVEEIWNSWTRDYDALAGFGFRQGLLIRYEDLVLNTEHEIRKIAEIANLTAPDKVAQIDENMSPTHDDEDYRAQAIQAIRSKSYLEDLSKDELTQACRRLSAELMLQHGYDDCTGIS